MQKKTAAFGCQNFRVLHGVGIKTFFSNRKSIFFPSYIKSKVINSFLDFTSLNLKIIESPTGHVILNHLSIIIMHFLQLPGKKTRRGFVLIQIFAHNPSVGHLNILQHKTTTIDRNRDPFALVNYRCHVLFMIAHDSISCSFLLAPRSMEV